MMAPQLRSAADVADARCCAAMPAVAAIVMPRRQLRCCAAPIACCHSAALAAISMAAAELMSFALSPRHAAAADVAYALPAIPPQMMPPAKMPCQQPPGMWPLIDAA